MIVVNTDYIQGKEITETLGLVKGSIVKAKWFGKDILAGLRNLVGGEVKNIPNYWQKREKRHYRE